MPLHRDSTLENIHRHHRWEVNNQAGLDALVPDALDIHKVAYKKDDDTYHVLKSVSPTVWVQTAYTKAKVDELLELKQDILTEGAFVDGDKIKLDNIEDGATADQTAGEIKTAYESNDDTNALTDSLLAILTTKKVKNVTTDAVNNKLVITYTDDTVANLSINDIVTDVHVSGATLDATTNVLTLTSTDGGADVIVDLSDFVNSGELTSALSGKADKIHSHSTSDITGLDAILSNKVTKNAAIIGATKTKITYDINGLVVNGADLSASDIPNLPQSKIINLETNLSSKIDKGVGVVGATKTKITYNNYGIITGGADLVEADLPNISQSKITNLVSDLSNKQSSLISGTNIKTINGQSVLGSGDIVITGGGSVQLTGNETIAGIKTFSSDIVGNITGNSGTATSANSAYKWTNARTITMGGDLSGSVSIDGSANVTLAATVANDSHTHEFANLTSRPTTLQGYGVIPEELPANIDLDTKTITGLYSQSANAEATLALNYPVALAGLLEVFAYSTMIHQRYWVYNSDDIYYRAKFNNGAWTSWTKGANVNDTVTAATKLATAITINGVAFDGSANITVSDDTKLTKTNPSIIGSITEQVYSLTGAEINPANGTIQYKTIRANTTFTETLISGQSVLLRLINANRYTITFPTITWAGAVSPVPVLTANCAIALWKEQSTLYGAYIGTLI